ncbi:MAG: type II secretion system F family protein [Nitrososphaerota archaeon]|nr:type II secretion system F family protein [Nitrososphaerota archaeon]
MKSVPRGTVEPKASLGPLDVVSGFAYRLFGRYADGVAANTPWLRDEILKSNMRITPEGLISLAFFGSVVSALVFVVEFAVALAFASPILLLISGAFAATPALVFLIIMRAPRISQGSRAAALDNELPFVVGFIVVLAGGGISPIASLRRIAKMSEIFPNAAKEARRVLLDIDVFGLDPITALEKAAETSPNKPFSELLYGYTTIIKTGGDLNSFLANKLKEIYESRALKVKKSSDTIGTLAEGYITITSVLGISLFVLFQAEALISHNSSGLQGVEVFGLVGVPLFSVLFLYVLNGVQARFPYVDYYPYKVFALSAPVGIVVFLVPLPLDLFLHTSTALMAATLPAMVVAMKSGRERNALEKALPDFFRDFSEGRKIGLSPEQTIQSLADKHYGLLSKHVKKMSSQVSWGVSTVKVISTFASEVRSWVTREAGMLLAEVIDVGGGTVRSFSDMADFTRKMNDLESEKRSTLKPYLFINYFAAIMVVVTTFIMVYFISTPIKFANSGSFAAPLPTINRGDIGILLTVSVFESWFIGIVAGKMGEGSVADGFKHAFALVLIALLSVVVAQAVMHISIL